jgi:hypothetical protein
LLKNSRASWFEIDEDEDDEEDESEENGNVIDKMSEMD